MSVRTITVRYHAEDTTWWAESADLPGFSAAADSLREVRRLVHAAVADLTEDDGYELLEAQESGAPVIDWDVRTAPVSLWTAPLGARSQGEAASATKAQAPVVHAGSWPLAIR